MILCPPCGVGLDNIHAKIDDQTKAFALLVNGVEVFKVNRGSDYKASKALAHIVADLLEVYTYGVCDADGFADGANDWEAATLRALAEAWDIHQCASRKPRRRINCCRA